MPRKKSTRLNHSDSEARRDRAMDDRTVTEDREITDAERLDEFRMSSFQSVLPDIPAIDGYHVCWLTSENPRDPIHGRMRIGYEPIKASDIPGWEHAALKSGQWEGCIGVNEMIAFKLPMHLYERYMREVHHDQPLAEEEKLAAATQMAQESASQLSRRPVSFELEDGMGDLGQSPDAPSFAETLGER